MGSTAIDESGNLYVWGNGTNGEMGNKTINSSYLPIKTEIKKAIQTSIGQGHIAVLTSEGSVWSWGKNTSGQLGIKCSANTSYPMKVALEATQLSAGGEHTTIKKVNNTLYATGAYSHGRLGIASTANVIVYTQVNLPPTVTQDNKVKYVKSGRINTTLLLTDGTIWGTGFNLQGELGNGTNTTSTSFVQGKTEEGILENILIIGKNNGDDQGSTTMGYGLNTAVITKDGDIYSTGDNTYGQIGDSTTENTSYYKRMGYAYLDYEDKTVEIDESGYQIDLNKLKYKYLSINAYNKEQIYKLGNIKYTSSNEAIAKVSETGKITTRQEATGFAKIKIEDTTNGYETYLSVIINRLEDTDMITYIYNAEDLKNFRNTVNAGDTYEGKSVYVMADIDMSTVCSETIGSWIPIGDIDNKFKGIFDGNYHKIDNIYINSKNSYQGLFGYNDGIIQNIIMNSGAIKGRNTTGSISGVSTGIIDSCGNYVNVNGDGIQVGGIVGCIVKGNVANCYNLGNIIGTGKDSYSETFTGGIAGFANEGRISNCYNRGIVKSSYRYAGGVLGGVTYASTTRKYLENCYNTGTVSASSYAGSIIADVSRYVNLSKCYYTTSNNYYGGIENGNPTVKNVAKVTAETLKTYSITLGTAFEDDNFDINLGYPILWWQAPTVELNKKQEYIKTGEELQLNIIPSDAVTKVLGGNIKTSDFTWTSTNEDIAKVNENGIVTGIKEGYTTIYGYHQASELYTMCIVNVAKNEANPQAETGEGFTAILKADGTVWTIGKNENGELGDGSNEEKIEAVQVKIDENTYLSNVKKISVGQNHVLALTKEGNVYAWGANTYGQLGQNNTENSNYAKLVLGEGGKSELDRIVDISAGSYGSIAVNEFGWVFVWGNGSYGEMGNNSTKSNSTPIKNTINTAISASMGAGHNAVLSQRGVAYTWGRNNAGQLGIGNVANSATVNEILNEVVQISAAGYETIVQKLDGTIYGTGLNTSGQLGIGNTTNVNNVTQIAALDTAIQTNKIKYIKAGRTSTSILLTDGSIYLTGNYKNSEPKSNFEQAKTKEGILENSIMVGRSSGEATSLDTVAINTNGRIYTIGSNKYGQIGNNTKNDNENFTQMGYIEVIYPEEIIMKVGETKELSGSEFSYIEKHFNVYNEDIKQVPLLGDASILDKNVAIYENSRITGKNIGRTTLMVKEKSTGTKIYIPVSIIAENEKVVPDVKTGNNFTITLKTNGTIWSFGQNENGELGLENNVNTNAPKQVETLKDKVIKEIAVGNNHVIALTEDGRIYTWGLNDKGQLGLGNTRSSNMPQEIKLPESTELVPIVKETAVKVIANKNVSYAITQSGKVYTWGENYGITPQLLNLQDKEENQLDIVDISNSYMLDINGNVYDLKTKQRLEIVEKIKYISEGNTHTVFLSENGTAYAIGSNTYGQFGDGTNVSNTTSVIAIRNAELTDILRNIVNIEAGDGYTVASLENGKIVAVGTNQKGELGAEEIEETNVIVENTSVEKLLNEQKQNIILMDAGRDHIAIALSNGNVYTWGAGEKGELGNGLNNDKKEVQLVGKNIVETNTNNLLLSENETFKIEANTTYFNLIEDEDRKITYESKNESVVLVDEKTGEVTARKQGTTVIVAREYGTTNISVIQVRVLPEEITIEPQVSTNGNHTVTLKVDGTVWSYGNNTNGELGDGTTNYSDEPVQAKFPENIKIIEIAAGENFSIALDSNGDVWAWGANDYYQLGNSKETKITTPTKVQGLGNITKIAAGTYSVMAIDVNKDLYGLGLNSNGELGIGSYTNKVAMPTKAKNMTDVIDIAVGKNHSIALKSTGEVFVTGLNIYGQLGNNDTSIKKTEIFTKVENISEVARITATDSGNISATVNGKVYSWGLNIYGELGLGEKVNKYVPTKVEGVENIIQVAGGKNHSILLNKSGKVYTSGSNKYGQIGNGTNTESTSYIEIPNVIDVMRVSAGNTYTTFAKTDGTVWGFGDYNHGNTELKSKTKSAVPMQVGNDAFGLGINKITIKKSETANISTKLVYSFNLIYLNKNSYEKIAYRSENEEIAIVNEKGEVLGVREGATWVKAIEEDGTEHVVYVYVTDNEQEYAPEITGGEDYAGVLKADGTIWTFGHNNNGELGIGSNRTKDIPEKTNVIASYKEIKAGESYTIAIRNDGTVWSYGKNNYGQLGIGSTKNGLNPVQVNGLTDIVQIAAGAEHAIALDSYGILYGWGRNKEGELGNLGETVLKPEPIIYTEGTIQTIWAGQNETIIINTKGEIYGYGELLNGKLENISNAVKVSIGEGYMLILTTEGEVYKYDGSNLTKYSELTEIIDIEITKTNNIAQTRNEKIYTWTSNKVPVMANMENVYTIGVGKNNSYVIKTDGTVYAKGENQYGQLGNGTRIDSLEEFKLVGDRTFIVEPESAIMYVNDVEDTMAKMQINEFNAFNESVKNAEEYSWTSSDNNVVTANNGTLKAISEGAAKITIKDNVTEAETTITRVVIPVEKDRIESIKVNDYEASVKEEYKYNVEVETNNNTATIKIQTKDKTDKISIDNGLTWYENGVLTAPIEMLESETDIAIIVETTNGTQVEYQLKVKKISTDVNLENVTVDGIEAVAISATNYEVVVPENTIQSEVIARAVDEKAEISIDGKAYLQWKSITTVKYGESSPLIVPIVVKAENGDELEYTLTIYRESEILKLESLTVDGKEAIKTSEGVYSITIPRNLDKVKVTAKAVSELVKASLNNKDAEIQITTKEIEIAEEKTEVQIRLSTIVNGKEAYRDYTLNIYEKAESGKIQFVMVNGQVLAQSIDGTYEIYLPANAKEATVKVISENEKDYVQIEDNEKEISLQEKIVKTQNDTNTYTIKIINDEGIEESYMLYIKKPSVDATLKQITVENGEYTVTAKESMEEKNVYIAKVKDYSEYTITARTNNIKAYVAIDEDVKTSNIATHLLTKTGDYIEEKINVWSENGDLEEYILKIYVMSNQTSLETVEVNGLVAKLQPDGSYLVNLETADTKVEVTAKTTDEKANVKIEDEEYELHTTIKNVIIDSKETIKNIYVKAEDGTVQKYKLVITGLPDDSTLQKVIVNGETAKYIEGSNKYEIRSDLEEFNIEAIAQDTLAKVSLNGGKESIAFATTTINKESSKTIVTIKVFAQNGIDSSIYTLEIKEKSNDNSIANVLVNGKSATKNADENYVASIAKNVETATIKVEANDGFATVYLDDETKNSSNISVAKKINQRETTYEIKVVSEDGTEKINTLTITRLENNTDIKRLEVVTTKQTINNETGEVTQTQNVQTPIQLEDGNYYLKIDRVEDVDIKAILEDANASVKIKESDYKLSENYESIETVAEKTQITITVKAEDETLRNYTLLLEKKSNDTTIKEVMSKDVLSIENATIYVDESIEKTELTLITNSNLAYIKLDTDEEYTKKQITRTIDLSEATKVVGEGQEGWIVNIEVKAEDGTIGNYTKTILKTGNTNIQEVKVNESTIQNKDDTYTARVNVLDTAKIEIIPQNINAKVEIIKTVVASDETITETVIASEIGTLVTDVPLNENPQRYIIRITSAKQSTTYDYNLVLQQKAQDTSISYVKVNSTNALEVEEGYKAVVSGKEEYPVAIKTTDEKAKVKISYGKTELEDGTISYEYESNYYNGKLTENISVAEGEVKEVTITVQSENGEEQNYILLITRISNNTKLEYVKVDGKTCTDFNKDTKTYTIMVDSEITISEIEAKTDLENATITIGTVSNKHQVTTNTYLDGPGTTKSVTIKVEAEDGTIENYYLKLVKPSVNVIIDRITVNDIEANKIDVSNYEVTISDKDDIAKLIVTAQEKTSTVSIEKQEATSGTATKTIDINGHQIIELGIVVTAEDGTTLEYNLKITVLERSNSLEYLKVNTGEIEPEADNVTYKTFVDWNSISSNVEIKTESKYAQIIITNTEDLTITEEKSEEGILNFIVGTQENITTIKYSVISQTGETKDYELILTKISTDNTLKELYVEDTLITVNEDGNYYTDLENAKEVKVKAIANSEYANIRIDYNAEEKEQTEATINAEKSSTKVSITITSQSGVTERYYLYIRVLENNTDLDKVIVDSAEVTDYEETNNTYTVLVDKTKNTYETFLMAVNDNATIELYNGETLISSGVGNLTELINLEEKEDAHTYGIKVSLDEEHYSNYKLQIVRNSNDTSLKLVEVNDVVRTPTQEDKYIYEVGIPKLAQTAKIKVQTTNSFATVRIGDNDIVKNGTTVNIELNLLESRITVPVVVTAADGITIDTFNILLTRQSNEVNIESIVVNNTKLENVNDVYTYYMKPEEYIAKTQISIPIYNNAKIEVEEKEGIGYLEFDEKISQDIIKVEKTIKVTSEDGSIVKYYTLIIMKETKIKGIITTQNAENKHISTISLYKEGKQLVEQLETKEDGSYEIEIEEIGTYNILVTKLGYLDYEIMNIDVQAGDVIELNEYSLISGDVVSDGEIELDDLTALNDNYVAIDENNKEEMAKYDLNEDGMVNKLDRDILKANYGKKKETVEWVKPEDTNSIMTMSLEDKEIEANGVASNEKQDFILPIGCEYRITSDYGTRTHPVTGEVKKHTGIDLGGTHHTEIYAVADGEVTFAGVQKGFGNCVEIKHVVNGKTVYSFYAHLSRIDVKAGDKITQGQVIGLEGGDPSSDPNPGSSTGHHLHFEIRNASGYGNDVDPNDYINF